jgi:hypothetical protein
MTAIQKTRRYRRSTLLMAALSIAGCDLTKISKAPAPTTDQGACVSYGFVPGTDPYINCVRREIEARRTGKIGPTYDQILVASAQ